MKSGIYKNNCIDEMMTALDDLGKVMTAVCEETNQISLGKLIPPLKEKFEILKETMDKYLIKI